MSGSLIAGPVFNYINNKFVVCVTIIGNMGCVLIFPLVDSYELIGLSRILVGFF